MTDHDHDRLKALSSQIQAMQQKQAGVKAEDEESARNAHNMNTGSRAGGALISLTIAGAVLGYGLDRVFHTSPLLLVFFLLAGIGLGFYEVYRITK